MDKEKAKDYKIPAEKSIFPDSTAAYVNYL